MQERILAGLLVAVFLPGSAPAGEIADKAAQTESLVANGKYVEAIEAFDQAMISLWDKLPLTFRKTLWIVVGSARGFGNYTPRETNVYRPSEEMVAYAEPVGFGWRKIRDDKRSDDIWQSDFAADITIKTKDGKHFYSQKDIGKGGMSSRARNREFNIRLTVTLTNIPAGEYMADFTVRDAVSGKRGTFSLPFVIK